MTMAAEVYLNAIRERIGEALSGIGGSSDEAVVREITDQVAPIELAPANPERHGMIVYNNSNAGLLLKFGPGASTTSFTVKVKAGESWVMSGFYKGLITGAWEFDTPVGTAQVTEW